MNASGQNGGRHGTIERLLSLTEICRGTARLRPEAARDTKYTVTFSRR